MERDPKAKVEPAPELIGEAPAWRAVVETLPRVSTSGLPVLILGETGTGKELVARMLHALSERRQARFVAHNCGATPDTLIESELFGHARGAFTGAVADREGLFDAAHRGTLFLDEIGDASALLQMKLLRVLQEGEVRRVGETRLRRLDVRIVSATHRALERRVGEGAFRGDLYYRLNAAVLRLPALRDRGRDVLLLAEAFLARSARALGQPAPRLQPALAERLLGHAWPGNVRELANGCAWAVRVAGARGEVGPAHWPAPEVAGAAAAGLLGETRALERHRLQDVLERTGGNRSAAARALGLSRQGLLNKLRRYGIDESRDLAPLDDPVGPP